MSREHGTVAAPEGLARSLAGLRDRERAVPSARWHLAWLLLTAALAGHVLDEALTDFLSFYNPAVEALRGSLPWVPLPTFTFEGWIAGLVVAVLALAALAPQARRGRAWMRPLSYLYGAIMTLNGLGHLGGSLALGRWLPGAASSPLLLAAALFLLASIPPRSGQPTGRRG